MSWEPFDNGATLDASGSEGGRIVRDVAHPDGARITLEADGAVAPWAITCGVYGLMVHTRYFADRADAEDGFDRMRDSLTRVLEEVGTGDDPQRQSDAARRFVAEFP